VRGGGESCRVPADSLHFSDVTTCVGAVCRVPCSFCIRGVYMTFYVVHGC
jgi:hypothetical protein